MNPSLRDALNERGYDTLTPVQTAVLDPELAGRDLLVSAQTGSGKTLAFGLAIAPKLLGESTELGEATVPLGLVIAPTRELALQVKRELAWLYAKAGVRMASCVGGMDMRDERRALARGAHIVVATPGRLRDHLMRGTIDLGKLRSVVLDEADEMLDLGFREDLEFILGEAPEERQTLLFSATVPNAIAKLAQSYQRDAERVVTKSETPQHADISYHAYQVAEQDAENAVINTLLYHRAPNAIVFGNTRAMVNRLTTRLSNRGFQVVALSGELSQSERSHALQAMRDGRAQVCVATDVAARGIDLPKLDLVVHAELPSNHETLLHRSGRTGRAGRKGISALIVPKKAQKKASRILGMAKVKAEWGEAPSAEAVMAREAERMFADPAWEEAVQASEQDAVDGLMSSFTPEQLAAGYLRLYRSVRSAPEELSPADAKPAPRPAFGPSVWFSVSGGRAAGAEPRRLLPMLCKASGLSREDIGAIRIQQEQSFVEVKEASVPRFLEGLGEGMTVERGAVVTQLDKAPELDRGKPGKPRPGKPHRKGPGPKKTRPAEENPTTKSAPIDWNDEPAPRAKKPKPKDRPSGKGKPGQGKPSSKAEPYKPKGDRKPGGKPKGPPPPKGKPNSKKNRARALAKKALESPKRGKGKR